MFIGMMIFVGFFAFIIALTIIYFLFFWPYKSGYNKYSETKIGWGKTSIRVFFGSILLSIISRLLSIFIPFYLSIFIDYVIIFFILLVVHDFKIAKSVTLRYILAFILTLFFPLLMSSSSDDIYKLYKNTYNDSITKSDENLKELYDNNRIYYLNNANDVLKKYYIEKGNYPNKIEYAQDFKYFIFKENETYSGKTINGCKFGYTYSKIKKDNKITGYVLSNCVESIKYLNEAKNDGGKYDNRYEIKNINN